jgi:hypothetical protein
VSRAKKPIEGVLEGYFETGTEGIIWAVYDETKTGYDDLHVLDDGDELVVLGDDGNPIWSGKIRFDYEIGYRPYPMNPEFGQQCARGCWVHGIQDGFQPDDWADLFFRRGGLPPYRALLTKGKRP